MIEYKNYIDGRFVGSATQFEDIDPATGAVRATVHAADELLVDRAVAAARAAQAGPWGRSTAEERADALDRIANGIAARFDEFLAAEVGDTGKPIAQARKLDIPRGIANFRTFANLLRSSGGETFVTPTDDGAGAINYTLRQPLGVVGIISPWNLPLLLFSWKVAPALACGNSLVAKPSEETPGSATLLAEVIATSGLPDGAFNLVHGHGAGSTGEAITRSPGVDAITFTGESKTGEAIMRAAAVGVRPVSFELGGKNAALVFADCNFDEAVEGVARSTLFNSGQVCLCTERVYVERSIYSQFVEALAARADQQRIGNPLDETTTMGPLISAEHKSKVESYLALALAEGAELANSTGPLELPAENRDGFYLRPAIWTGLAPDARCLREEVFGPVCAVIPFDGEDQAVAYANATDYGLACSIWTSNLSRGHRLAARVRGGLVWLNSWFLRDLRAPFGGSGQSGIGREGGHHSLDFYSDIKNVCVKL